MVWWWFGVNMAGLRNIRNTNAFKFILQVFILSQKHILGVKKVVWCYLDVVWGGLEVVWGVLGWFGVFPRTVNKGNLTSLIKGLLLTPITNNPINIHN